MSGPGTISGPAILAQFFTTLSGLTYPPNLNYANFTPGVFWLGTAPEDYAEQIELDPNITDTDIQWRTTASTQVEVIVITVRITTYAAQCRSS